MKKNRGISLIVLIITILVVIILAAAVLLTHTKNNPIESAKEARFKEDVRTFQDELALTVSKQYAQAGGQRDEKIFTSDFDEIKEYIPSFSEKYKGKFVIDNDCLVYIEYSLIENEKKWAISLNLKKIRNSVPQEWRAYIADVTEDGVPIPKGFTYKEGTKETGVVIEDSNQNEFVWISVDNIDNYKNDFSFKCRGNVDKNKMTDDMLPNGVNSELDDIRKYYGFYIGRYESTIPSEMIQNTSMNIEGIPTCKKNREVWTNIDYINAKKSAEKFFSTDNLSARSGLITGKAWDTICHYIEDYKINVNGHLENISINDSRKYGNYFDSVFPASDGRGVKQKSGYNENWKVKNIYDLAGNVWSWTSEMSGSYNIIRGGGYMYNGGSICPVSYRHEQISSDNANIIGFRVRLYIKIE